MSDQRTDQFNWEIQDSPSAPVSHGDIRNVILPVKAVFEWREDIVTDRDTETGTPLEFTSGFVMHIMPNQSFIYKQQPSVLIANAQLEIKKGSGSFSDD